MKNIFAVISAILLATCLLSPILVFAQSTGGSVTEDINKNLEGLGTGAGYGSAVKSTSLPQLIGKIINIFLSILGVLFVVLMVYGGYLWMTSFGNPQKVDKARELITDAVIGLLIILAAYGIANFVVGQLVKATTT